MTFKDSLKQIDQWRRKKQVTVLTTGVFDLLHIEHINFLTQAKAAGDKLVVGIETDARVQDIKGPDRPVNSQAIRLKQIQSLKAVDSAFILPAKFNTQADWEQLIDDLHPDIYAVSSHTSHLKNKRVICRKFGVKLKVVHNYNPDFSTSLLIAKLINPHMARGNPRFSVQVVTGHGRGKMLGFPTLNLVKPVHFPYQHGIYAGYVWINSHKYLGAFHFGPVPVFDQLDESLEVFVLNSKIIKQPPVIEIQIMHYLRPIKQFDTSAALTTQIQKDVYLTQTLLKT